MPSPRQLFTYPLLGLVLLLPPAAHALILYSGDNAANQSAPDAAYGGAAVFNAVGRVTNTSGSATNGSAVHLTGKYVLTANHVNGLHAFEFNTTIYLRDTSFAPIRFGSSDMKLVKLIDDPGLADTPLYTGTSETPSGPFWNRQYTSATLVGWGRGRDPADNSGPTWTWGNDTTIAKRWGRNQIEGATSANYSINNIAYSYTALYTSLSTNSGDIEAAISYYDSGSGLFIEDAGTWKLAGLTTSVETFGSSTFASSGGDQNNFVRISTYAAAIQAAIPDLSVYDDWLIDHGLYNAAALATADTDFDGMPQLLEFALGGDPNAADSSLLPTQQIVDENGASYLEIHFTRPQGLTGISYAAQTTSDLGNWPSDSSGVDAPTLVTNGDGSETVRYRRSLPLGSAEKAFLRIVVSTQP